MTLEINLRTTEAEQADIWQIQKSGAVLTLRFYPTNRFGIHEISHDQVSGESTIRKLDGSVMTSTSLSIDNHGNITGELENFI